MHGANGPFLPGYVQRLPGWISDREGVPAMPRAQIKDEKTYQELRKQGASKEKFGTDRKRVGPHLASCSRRKGR